MLLARSLETMALCADLVIDTRAGEKYKTLSDELRKKIFDIYWDNNRQAIVHSREDGKPTENVTRYSNMFSIFFNYFNEQQKQAVKRSVLLNDSIQKITTPYMRFYELEALCAMGEQDYVLKEMKDYWGGMLKLGATSFWEEYNPQKKGEEHLAMYGRKFGKSLCHAWGASPIYLLGKYYIGVKPLSPGYARYSVEPVLGGLQWMEGSVPTPHGNIKVYCSRKEIKISSDEGMGILRIKSRSQPEGENIIVNKIDDNSYEITISPRKEYRIKYEAL